MEIKNVAKNGPTNDFTKKTLSFFIFLPTELYFFLKFQLRKYGLNINILGLLKRNPSQFILFYRMACLEGVQLKENIALRKSFFIFKFELCGNLRWILNSA